MNYLQTSHDILNIVLAVSAGAVAFFVCWLLLYMVLSFRKAYRMIDDIGKIIQTVKEKAENFSAYFYFIGEGIKKILELLGDKEKRNKTGEDESEKSEAHE